MAGAARPRRLYNLSQAGRIVLLTNITYWI